MKQAFLTLPDPLLPPPTTTTKKKNQKEEVGNRLEKCKLSKGGEDIAAASE